MAIAVPHADRSAHPLAGLAAAVTPLGERTVLTVRTATGGQVDVEVAGRPDPRAAHRVRSTHRRLTWQRIDVAGPLTRCTVRGARHRVPTETMVSLGAALALAADGIPTVVHVRPQGTANEGVA